MDRRPSAAAVLANDGRATNAGGSILGVGLVVTGGLVEGIALGVWQSLALRRVLGRSGSLRWVVATTAVAGLGWAAGSLPSVIGDQSTTRAQLPWPLILAGAAGLGLAMGAVLGLVQAFVLRGRVGHAFRWVSISAVGWSPAMVVMFAGATAPSVSWHPAAVVGFGAVTGALAGVTLGAATGPLLPGLSGQPPHNLVVLALCPGTRSARRGGGRCGGSPRSTCSWTAGGSREPPLCWARGTRGTAPHGRPTWRGPRGPGCRTTSPSSGCGSSAAPPSPGGPGGGGPGGDQGPGTPGRSDRSRGAVG